MLIKRGNPGYLVRILIFWYSHQTMMVRWGNVISDPFTVSNGIHQGDILSPYLFNVYMDDLSNELNAYNIGCVSGNIIINHLMYADDLVLLCPYSKGLATLLKICARYGIANDILYNSKKSALLFMSTKDDTNLVLPIFWLDDEVLPVVEVTKYLGHFFTNDLHDDKDIQRQCCKLYGQGNMLIRKFNICTIDVKVSLSRTFCTPLYTAQL